jgi:hypothetical protein
MKKVFVKEAPPVANLRKKKDVRPLQALFLGQTLPLIPPFILLSLFLSSLLFLNWVIKVFNA